ncbi:MAG: DUF4349 domain-containing protein [Actinomycetota bacterium]
MKRLAISIAAMAALLAACAQDQASQAGGGGDSAAATAPEFDQARQGGVGGGGGYAEEGVALGAAPTQDLPAIGPTVIKTADLEVEVEHDGFGDAMDSVTQVAAKHGGFVVSSTTSGEESRRGSITVRIPSDRFETALGEIRGLGKVQRETVAGEDVGQEFVDLEARVRNLSAQEAVLLRLFDDASTVADTIRIQNELAGVQLEIERLEGRLRYLQDQTELGTISVSLLEEGVSPRPAGFVGAFERAVDGMLAVLSGLIVFFGYAIPIALVAIPLWLVGRRAMRRFGAPAA